MTAFRPGVLPNDPSKPRLRLSAFLTGAPITPPPAVNWDRVVKSWPMDANDRYGDCVWAMIGHTIQTWTANTGTEVDVPVANLLKGYSDVTGFNPGDPATDQGTVMQDAFDYWRKTGIIDAAGKARKILAFAQVDHTNVAELEAAAGLFGEVLLAIDFPATAMDQFDAGRPWDVVPGAKIEGGHAICSARYDTSNPTAPWVVITWGKEQYVTSAFMATYLSEAWVAIAPEWVPASGAAPSGLDLHALGAEFAAITGQPNPFPAPVPPTPPTPPGPPQFPGALVAAVTALARDPKVAVFLQRAHIGVNADVADHLRAVLAAPRA